MVEHVTHHKTSDCGKQYKLTQEHNWVHQGRTEGRARELHFELHNTCDYYCTCMFPWLDETDHCASHMKAHLKEPELCLVFQFQF